MQSTRWQTARPGTARGRGWRARAASEAGFSLAEIFVVCAIFATMSAMTIMVTAAMIQPSKAESAAATVRGFLQTAREHAISHRRLVRISFPENNKIISQEVQLDGTLKDLTSLILENRMQWVKFDGIVDTPDHFGGADAVYFTGTAPVQFTSDGMFVDTNGDPTTGTVSIGVPHDTKSISAVTILGTTALVRQWRWDGVQWVE